MNVPAYALRRLRSSVPVRFRRINLPLLIAFISALFMFLRALSGAGYVEQHNAVVTVGYWTSLKATLFACPESARVNDTETQPSIACLRERLGAAGGRVLAAGGVRTAPEDRAFRASLKVVPPPKVHREDAMQ